MHRSYRVAGGLTLLVMLLAFALLTSVNMPALAQGPSFGTPTPTPTDFTWLAFSAARDAIQVEKGVDLFYVRTWEWEFTNYPLGIEDGCNPPDNPAQALQIYAGWTITITSVRGDVFQARVANNRELSPVIICENAVIAPTAPPGTPVAGLPTPLPGSGATGSFELGGHIQNLSTGTFNYMNQAGMRWIKKQYRFFLGQDAATSAVAGWVQTAHANGFKLLVGLVGIRDELGGADYNTYIQQFSSFAAGLARLGVDAIEIWNEPNIDREWPLGRINGATYTQMLAAAYNAIRAANPSTIVISGAPAPTGFFGGTCTNNGCDDDVFMRQMRDAGAGNYMDCVGLHYNEGVVPPTQNANDPIRGDSYPTRFFGPMTARGDIFGKPVCYTEFGYLTPEGYGALPAGFEWARQVTIQNQADWLASAASLAATGGRIRLMIVWNVDFTLWGADPMAGFAIIRQGGACPACTTLGAVMRR